MKHLELLDEAIHLKRGKWDTSFEYLVYSNGNFHHEDVNGLSSYTWEPHWFHMTYRARAKELGYFNGYRWGVEYPTNGQKPDLPDDVVVDVKLNNGYFKNAWGGGERLVGVSMWSDAATAFRIVDLRHKPADISYIPLEQRPNHMGEPNEKGDVDAAIESMRDIRTAFANQAVSQFKTSTRYVEQHPCGLSKVEVTIEPDIDFEWLANQFDDADDINAVWALRDKLHHKNKPETSPELSFHLSNAFNELQASARLLPEDDPRRASIVSLAGGVGAVKEVA